MTARKTSASATDLRLWLAPALVVMETVKRLATTVKTSNTSHESKPARVRRGSFIVEIRAEDKSNRPRVEMLPSSNLFFQLLGISIFVGAAGELPRRRNLI